MACADRGERACSEGEGRLREMGRMSWTKEILRAPAHLVIEEKARRTWTKISTGCRRDAGSCPLDCLSTSDRVKVGDVRRVFQLTRNSPQSARRVMTNSGAFVAEVEVARALQVWRFGGHSSPSKVFLFSTIGPRTCRQGGFLLFFHSL